ncbi:MAG: phosphoribosylaminoimidazolesuccinocarboxamide synthase [Candidatus Omnitrophica bacterium]|nr:phosphoribosylaminoimidazolesuccinocarboxamide synthase [Candidatus Omnitrophota bacterium]MCM8827406.1 phosphoribosylaminoimidazolesuccinocarboxamide synthase [Candidatus Omnitrophota bacterium]
MKGNKVSEIVYNTELKDLKLIKRGKVRDIYELDDKHLLIVSTDRISCFDVVLPTGIPNKGKVLNQLSSLWFNFTRVIVPNHFVTTDVSIFPQLVPYLDMLRGRSMVVNKARPIPLECVVRGYLAGSAWKEYKESQMVCGIKLPQGLKESDKLPEPIFTPARKVDSGHDENLDYVSAQALIGNTIVQRLRDISIQLYKGARIYAFIRKIIIADTKFEFGFINNEIVLIDEVLTPDSSRFWPRDSYLPGQPQVSFDKQFVRDYLESLGWDKNPPAPHLPPEIVAKTEEKYRHVLKLLAGRDIED